MAQPQRKQRQIARVLTGLAAATFVLTACETAAPASQTETPAAMEADSEAALAAKRAAKASAPCPDYGRGSGTFQPPFPANCAGLQTTEDGLRWIEIAQGPEDREPPLDGATVIVAYEGYLAETGAKFDSSYDRGEAAIFVIAQVISEYFNQNTRVRPCLGPRSTWQDDSRAHHKYDGR